jgi:hypothetical protein
VARRKLPPRFWDWRDVAWAAVIVTAGALGCWACFAQVEALVP